MVRAVLHLCQTCEPEQASAALQALQDAVDLAELSAEVRPQSCMNACSVPVSLSLQGEGRATYFFTGVQPETDTADIVNTVRLYLESPGGWIEDARPCGRLRLCLSGRVPALSSEV